MIKAPVNAEVLSQKVVHSASINEFWARYKNLGWHFFVAKGVFAIAILSGLYSLYEAITIILVVLPQLPSSVGSVASDSLSFKLLEEAVIASTAGFAESAFGLFMMIKPYKAVENFQIVIALGLIALSAYLRLTGQLLDL